MALKAGYVGVKRWIYEKLGNTVKLNSDQLAGISNFSGAKNLLAFPYAQDSWSTAQGLSATANADGSITLSGTLSAPSSILLHGRSGQTDRNAFTLPAGTYIASKNIVPGVILELNILKSGSKFVIADVGANTEQVTFTLEEAAQIGAQLITASGVTTISGTVKPMIRLATDPDATYAPYAMTNQQLTAEAATLEGVDDAHKTVINGIISAATGAADFAAFKTAMAALTPLTRSAALDTREASPEVIEEPEPVTRKTTTKTSTKKEDN